MLSVLASMTAGMITGFFLRKRPKLFSYLDPATSWVVRLLLLLLGYGIGKDSELVARIPELGLKGLVLAVSGILGSVLMARILVGRPLDPKAGEIQAGTVETSVPGNPGLGRWRAVRGSLIAVAAFFLGVACGLLFPAVREFRLNPETPVLYILMFLVGMGAGADPTVIKMMRHHGLRLLLLPLAVVIGTFIGTLAAAVLWPALPIRESLAVGAGYGYYSLSSLVIRELSGSDWAAVALLSNIAREIITLLAAPLLVSMAGPAAPAAAGGATSMDTTLAATVQNSGRAWAVPALFSGVVLTVLVPFAVTLILTL